MILGGVLPWSRAVLSLPSASSSSRSGASSCGSSDDGMRDVGSFQKRRGTGKRSCARNAGLRPATLILARAGSSPGLACQVHLHPLPAPVFCTPATGDRDTCDAGLHPIIPSTTLYRPPAYPRGIAPRHDAIGIAR